MGLGRGEGVAEREDWTVAVCWDGGVADGREVVRDQTVVELINQRAVQESERTGWLVGELDDSSPAEVIELSVERNAGERVV